MTHDEIFIHLGTLSAMDGWLWIYAQTPAIQTMALRNMVALGAETSGMKPDAAWSYALRAVPEDDGQPWFTGVDPDGEWIAALDAFNEVDDGDEDADADAWDAWVDDLSEDPAAFQEVGNGYWSQSDTATTLCTGPGAGMRNLVTHEGRVGSGRVGSGRVGSGRVGSVRELLFDWHGQDARATGPHNVSPTLTRHLGSGGHNVPLVVLLQETESGDVPADKGGFPSRPRAPSQAEN